jgi:hypothetical protein
MNLLAVPLVVALLAVPVYAGAADTTLVRSYETGALNVRLNVADPVGVTDDGSFDHGGVYIEPAFFPLGSTLDGVRILDQTQPRVRGLLCQDLNGDAVCGQGDQGEPRVEFCDDLGPGNVLSANGHPVTGGAAVVVFVFATPVRLSVANLGTNGPAPCPDGSLGFATAGTVTLSVAP